ATAIPATNERRKGIRPNTVRAFVPNETACLDCCQPLAERVEFPGSGFYRTISQLMGFAQPSDALMEYGEGSIRRIRKSAARFNRNVDALYRKLKEGWMFSREATKNEPRLH